MAHAPFHSEQKWRRVVPKGIQTPISGPGLRVGPANGNCTGVAAARARDAKAVAVIARANITIVGVLSKRSALGW